MVVILSSAWAPAGAAPGDPCPAAAPVEGTIDVDTIDRPAADPPRNHLTGRIGSDAVDYLSPPGEQLDDSVAAMVSEAGLPPGTPVTATVGERSVLVALHQTTTVLGCVADGAAGFVEVVLTDGRLSFTGDPVVDPGAVQVTTGYLAVTVTRHRTERPIVEIAVAGSVPGGPAVGPPGDPVRARPTFVG
jgi:hypothetical protein